MSESVIFVVKTYAFDVFLQLIGHCVNQLAKSGIYLIKKTGIAMNLSESLGISASHVTSVHFVYLKFTYDVTLKVVYVWA